VIGAAFLYMAAAGLLLDSLLVHYRTVFLVQSLDVINQPPLEETHDLLPKGCAGMIFLLDFYNLGHQ